MNNTHLLNLINLINLIGGSKEIVKIDDDDKSSTSEYTKSYLDSLYFDSDKEKEFDKLKSSEKFELDSELESQVRQSLYTNQTSKIVNLSKLNQTYNVDSEEELKSIINNYSLLPTTITYNLDSITTQTGGKINKKLNKINKQIELLEYELF